MRQWQEEGSSDHCREEDEDWGAEGSRPTVRRPFSRPRLAHLNRGYFHVLQERRGTGGWLIVPYSACCLGTERVPAKEGGG